MALRTSILYSVAGSGHDVFFVAWGGYHVVSLVCGWHVLIVSSISGSCLAALCLG